MPDRKSIRIMVVDDERLMLKLVARLLTNLGYTSIVTHNSATFALETFLHEADHPDLVVIDLNMPDMDGLEFIRHLVEKNFDGSIILISGEQERTLHAASRVAQAHHMDVLGYLHKPVSQANLSVLMQKWMPHVTPVPVRSIKHYTPEELQRAITYGELVNYYQPKVSLSDGRVVGVETLVRWQHPTDGLVYPDQFISIAENHGLIDSLTRAVMRDALFQLRLWQDAGLSLRIAVNVSMENLVNLSFVDFVSDTAADAGVAPSMVVLEITESRLMDNLNVQLEVMTRLRLKQFRLSIDDFGTGHSSLSQLRDIPFEELKIDHGFVHRAHADETQRAICDASLSLARQLNMEVVGEGVEDNDDWEYLRSTDCDQAQGYFIAKPMPAHDLPNWIKTWELRMLHSFQRCPLQELVPCPILTPAKPLF